MLYQFFAILLCLVLLFLCAVRKLSFFSPPAITGSVWIFVFLTGMVFGGDFFPITNEAFVAWLLWFLAMGVGAYFFTPSGRYTRVKSLNRKLPFDYTILIVILIFWLSYATWKVGTSGPMHFFFNLRMAATGGEDIEVLGLAGRFYPLIFALFIFENVHASNRNKHLRILCWVWMLLYAIATMGKFGVITPIFTWVLIRGIQGRLRAKLILSITAATFFLMLVIHFARAMDGDEISVFELIAIYIYSPIVALGYMDTVGVNEQFGPFVFRFFHAVMYSLNMGEAPQQTILNYVSIPVDTNVYTVMQPFFNDFSFFGVFLGAIIYATIFATSFKFALRGGYALSLYASIFVALISQFFADLFLTNLSLNLQIIIFLSLIFIFSRKENVS